MKGRAPEILGCEPYNALCHKNIYLKVCVINFFNGVVDKAAQMVPKISILVRIIFMAILF